MLIDEALDAIADRLSAIVGLTVTTDPGARVTPPMALVTDGQIEYHSTFGRGYDQLNVPITVYVSKADSAEGALELRLYKSGHGDLSIRQALETAPDPTDNLEALVAVTGDAGIVDRGNGEMFLTLQVAATAQIKGKES